MTKKKLLELINGVTGAVFEQAINQSPLNKKKLDMAWASLYKALNEFYAALDGTFL